MRVRSAVAAVCLCAVSSVAGAQTPEETAPSRASVIAAQQHEKATQLEPYQPNRAEAIVKEVEQLLAGDKLHWHPFFESAYRGGGFTLGGGYLRHVGDYNWVDVRGSATFSGYLRFEGEFRAPRLFDRRGSLSIVGGWRQATAVGYYGLGTAATSADDEAFYSFTQPYASATLDVRPHRRWLVVSGGLELSQWRPDGSDAGLSIEDAYTPESAPGLGASPTYLQLFGAVAADTRTAPGYTRRGGRYSVTANSYVDDGGLYGFRRFDYDAIQHVPVARDAWVLSLHGRVETTHTSRGQQVPFFMMPALGGGSDLRGFGSWRFRDLNSLLLQAEWRVLVNTFFDTALFVDAGKVTNRAADLDFRGLKSDYGIGFRIHGLLATPLRIDLARGNEGFHLVFSSNAVF
jgi:hypothetical protein